MQEERVDKIISSSLEMMWDIDDLYMDIEVSSCLTPNNARSFSSDLKSHAIIDACWHFDGVCLLRFFALGAVARMAWIIDDLPSPLTSRTRRGLLHDAKYRADSLSDLSFASTVWTLGRL